MSINNQTLADLLREAISKRIDMNLAQLVKTPTDRIAGRIEGYREVLAFVDEEISRLNNPTPSNGSKN